MDSTNLVDSKTLVSFFHNVTCLKPNEIPFSDFLFFIKSQVYEYRIDLIRYEGDKHKRNLIKSSLPAICTSALFSNERRLSDVVKTTNIISIDIDNILDIDSLFNKLLSDSYVFACFHSPSFTGLKVFFKAPFIISTFIEVFLSLQRYFILKYNVCIDPVCKDITRLCYISSDSDLYFNPDSDVYTDKLKPPQKPKPQEFPANYSNNLSLTEIVINKIINSKIDITSCYLDWIRIAYSFVSEFGSNGLKYFLQVSQYYEKFNPDESIKVYNSCLRNNSNRVTIATFFKIAAWHGITYKN